MKTSKLSLSWLSLFLSMSLASPAVMASNWWYVEAGATRATVNVSQLEFNPILPRYKMGLFINQHYLLEIQYAGSGDDKKCDVTTEIEAISAAYLRLDSGVLGGIRMYALLGTAQTKLHVKDQAGSTVGTDTYEGFSWGLGLENRIWTKHTLLTLEYTKYYEKDKVNISGISLGFKFEY